MLILLSVTLYIIIIVGESQGMAPSFDRSIQERNNIASGKNVGKFVQKQCGLKLEMYRQCIMALIVSLTLIL